MQIEFTIDEIKITAQKIWEQYRDRKIWAFRAPMGAGKTTFIKALCNDVLRSNNVVTSPTFTIINEYRSEVAGAVFHMDWYRLNHEQEAVNAGVEDVLQSGNLCLIEWCERAPLLLPDDTLYLNIEIKKKKKRRIRI
jgi:tRNA threonylcarbamoyladenosine biosynthesis protein TsaE